MCIKLNSFLPLHNIYLQKILRYTLTESYLLQISSIQSLNISFSKKKKKNSKCYKEGYSIIMP